MDAYQHVNNTVYFRYFETARIAYFEKLGIVELREESGIGTILGSVQCKFKIPLTYPDRISVGVRVTQIQEERFVIEHCIVSHKHQKVAAKGEGVVVAYDYSHLKKVSLSAELKRRIEELESRGQLSEGTS
jgi:acyl-CoA thioester hydrolase